MDITRAFDRPIRTFDAVAVSLDRGARPGVLIQWR
jgi:hypothetical protein